MQPRHPIRRHARPHVLAALASLALATGCRVVSETAKAPGRVVDAIVPSKEKAPVYDPERTQSDVMRLADEFIARTNWALDQFPDAGGQEDPAQLLRWRLANSQAAIAVVSRPDPVLAVADLAGTTALTRMALERRAAERPGSPFDAWLAVAREVEAKSWDLARKLVGDEVAARGLQQVTSYFASDPDAATAALEHPQQLILDVQAAAGDKSSGAGLLGAIGLDPFSGLDPAVKEIAQARLLGERFNFALQHMPQQIHWQAQLLVHGILAEHQVETLVDNTTRAVDQVERAVSLAEALPDRVATTLQESSGPLQQVSTDLRQTLDSGTEMSRALDATLKTFDTLMKRFGVGEPPSEPAPPAAAPSRPFDILDYARTADSLTAASRELDGLLGSLGATLDSPAWEARLADVERVSATARADAQSLLDRAFLLGAAWIALALLAAISYRFALRRRRGAPERP